MNKVALGPQAMLNKEGILV